MGGGVDREAIFQDIKQAKFNLSGSGGGGDDDDDDGGGGGGGGDIERPQDDQWT